ncbi:hypothetical protein BH11MYX1_BH11MYX1_40710 [soil metagenome]
MAAACGDNSTNNSGLADQCNPLGGQGCMLPWPSNAYTRVDPTSATGLRVDLPLAAMPTNLDNIVVDPTKLNRWDGFSPSGPLLAMFPKGVLRDNLPTWQDPAASLAADSPIVLIDLDTGERTAFFAETDATFLDPSESALIIRPLQRLREKAHYAVAITKRVKAADGSALESPPGFAALRDGEPFAHPRFAVTANSAALMFGTFAGLGLAKSDIVLAWDFTTASDEFLQSDLTTMRDAALPAIGDRGAKLSFVATEAPPIAGIYKAFTGTFKSPNFLSNGEANESVLVRDASTGKPVLTGMRDANFAALVPDCVKTTPGPHTTIVFGHGLLGSAAEYLNDSFTQSLAEQYCFIIVAGDFIGFTSRQVQLVTLAVNDLNLGYGVTEKLGQSIIDFIALENAIRGPMSTAPEFQYNGAPVIDPDHTYYVGGSLGGIMGNVFMAYDPNILRGVLAVPGGTWSMLMERSNAFHILQPALIGSYNQDPSVYELNVALFGMAFEPYDAITTAGNVLKHPLAGVPEKKILMWYSIGDCLVSNITTEMVARTMGIGLIGPAVKSVWGLRENFGPQSSGINVFDDHPTPLPSELNIPPGMDNGTHAGINRKPAALREVSTFILGDQVAAQTCVSAADHVTPVPCDCATGACN